MFVRQSKFDALWVECNKWKLLYEAKAHRLNEKIDEWNGLIDIINNKGGTAFLERGVIPASSVNILFTAEEISKLIMLCHPDKHNGKPVATEMTQKLLAIKG